jgi:hypothetical protein
MIKKPQIVVIPLVLVFMVFYTSAFCKVLVVDHKIASPSAGTYDFLMRTTGGETIAVYSSIQPAVDAATESDTIMIREGMYKEAFVVSRRGLTIMNYNDEVVIIDGNNPRLGPLVKIEKPDIKLSGLKVMHSSSYGILSLNNSNIHISHCEVSYSEDGGIVFVNGENVIVEHCRVHHNNYKGLQAGHEGITMRGVRNFEVRYCEVYDNKEEGIDAKYGALHGKIHHNKLYRNNGPQIYVDVANHIDIFNNIIFDAVSKAGISVNIESEWKPEELPWTLHNIKIYNNVIFNNQGGIGFWLEPGKGSEEHAHWDSIWIYNNTLVNNSRSGSARGGGIYIANGKPHNFGDNIIINNNILWEKTNGTSRCIRDHAGEIIGKFIISHNLFPKGEPSDSYGKHPLVVPEVGFEDPLNNNYRIGKYSPAAGKGDPAMISPFDIDNRKRINTDIGAFQVR